MCIYYIYTYLLYIHIYDHIHIPHLSKHQPLQVVDAASEFSRLLLLFEGDEAISFPLAVPGRFIWNQMPSGNQTWLGNDHGRI